MSSEPQKSDAQASAPPSEARPGESRLIVAALAGLLCLTPACSSDDSGPGEITSSKKVASLDAAGFKALCDARSGTVEEMAHCGGLASARGFSYDAKTQLLSEHSCKGANTCAGWNCVTDKAP